MDQQRNDQRTLNTPVNWSHREESSEECPMEIDDDETITNSNRLEGLLNTVNEYNKSNDITLTETRTDRNLVAQMNFNKMRVEVKIFMRLEFNCFCELKSWPIFQRNSTKSVQQNALSSTKYLSS